MRYEIPVLSITSGQSPEQILEKIKNVQLYGLKNRGYPDGVLIQDIVRFTDKNGKYVWEGPSSIIDDCPKNLDDFFEEHGLVCRETVGKDYGLSTTDPNPSMSNTFGSPTCFQYRVFNDGREDLMFDGIPSGDTDAYNPDFSKTTKKITNSSLKKVVEVINPNSKLL